MGLLSRWRKKKPIVYSASSPLKPLEKPGKSRADKQLKLIAKAFLKAQRRHETLLQQLQGCNCLAESRVSQDSLIAFMKEIRGLTDGLETCLLLLISDYHEIDTRQSIRPFLERALQDLQKAVD